MVLGAVVGWIFGEYRQCGIVSLHGDEADNSYVVSWCSVLDFF